METRLFRDESLDIAKTTPAKNFNAHTKSRKINNTEIKKDNKATIRHPDLPLYVRELADKRGLSRIVVIGCDTEGLLLQEFSENEFNVTGIDQHNRIEILKNIYPKRRWMSVNFTDAYAIDSVFGKLDTIAPTLFVISDTIENIVDPRLLLRKIRQLLKTHKNSVAVIATPDAEKSQSYNLDTKLPNDTAHVREWNLEGLTVFLQSSGFNVISQGYTRTDDCDTNLSMCLILLTADEKSHLSSILSMKLPRPSKLLLITSEHADTKVTGGIGSYVKEVERVTADIEPIVLFCGGPALHKTLLIPKPDQLIDIRSVVNWFYVKSVLNYNSSSTSVYEAVRNLTYIYDQIETVEYQEYMGIGARLSQAKKAGAIAADVALMVRCHGSQVYIDRSTESWSGIQKSDIFELERMSIRYADIVSSPTKYLRDLYLSTGYELNGHTIIQRLPYHYRNVPNPKYEDIDTLVFLGKRTTMKGYDDFMHLALTITDSDSSFYTPQIKRVVVIARPSKEFDRLDQDMVSTLEKRQVNTELLALDRARVLSALESLSKHSLMILPYKGDNHPVTILEAIESQIDFVAYDKGGIPELIPEKLKPDFLCYGDKEKLVEFVQRKLNTPADEKAKKLNDICRLAKKQQITINNEVKKTYEMGWRNKLENREPGNGEDATVMVPCYGTDLKYVEELIYCLNQQSMYPNEVIFINDATPDEEYEDKLKDLIQEKLKISWRMITHDVNKGLAAARNTALGACKTKYLINVDSDDLVANDFVYDYVTFMSNNPTYDVAICTLESFTDKDNDNVYVSDHNRYRYLGLGDCLILGLKENVFGHSGSCVSVDAARKIGGWDSSDRSMWEDWAFYIKITSAGGKIFNFPKINYFYRINDNSMARTYAKYPAQLRLVRNITGLNIWESERLYSAINNENRNTPNVTKMSQPRAYEMVDMMRPVIHRARLVKQSIRRKFFND